MNFKHIILTVFVTSFSIGSVASANTFVTLSKLDANAFSRHSHSQQVLFLALDKTVEKYGDYTIVRNEEMSRERSLEQLKKGYLSVHVVPTNEDWENSTIPVYIPVSKGLLGFRMLLIREEDQSIYSNVNDSEQLNLFLAGLGTQWSTTKVLRHFGYKVVAAPDYNGLFKMLSTNRFDYFIRGVNEIFGEFDNIKNDLTNIKIEDDLVLFIPLPIYIFVSPSQPELAKRIEEGLEMAIDDGSFDKLFNESHGANLELADLKNRKLIHIGNPLIKDNKNTNNPRYWLNPFDE